MEHTSAKLNFGAAIVGGMVFLALLHFSFAALQGDFGLFRLIEIEAEESRLTAELDALRLEHAAIANKTKRLSNNYLDLDLLDEQSRKVLGMSRGDEIIIR
jgi:cell division protein FtsB